MCAGLSGAAAADVASELKANDIRSVEALVSIIQQQHEDFVDLREVLPGNKFKAARQELEDRFKGSTPGDTERVCGEGGGRACGLRRSPRPPEFIPRGTEYEFWRDAREGGGGYKPWDGGR